MGAVLVKVFISSCFLPSDSSDNYIKSLVPLPAIWHLVPSRPQKGTTVLLHHWESGFHLMENPKGLLPLGTAQPGSCKHTQLCLRGMGSHTIIQGVYLVLPPTCVPCPACTHLAKPSAPSWLSPE